ncbi:MAG: hypothetical protein IPF74_00305 [Rhodocyclaceae bacterium]|nr:hypothetical protein [Rhodocyclaceae bacterium]
MRILPVIDLLDGHVVRAVAGERARYRPVRSRLAVDADPVAVCAALLELAPFAAVYVADLDAITRDGSRRNVDALLRLGAVVRRRGVRELWLDAGRAAWTGELAAHLAALGVELVPVIGSESLAEDERPRDLAAAHTDFALSLDYRAGAFIGPPALARAAHLWPRRVLAMELAGVGMRRGPPLELLATLRERAKAAGRADVELHAGGGVRDAADLRRLETAGVAGALVATALHDGSLDAVALRPHFGRVAA